MFNHLIATLKDKKGQALSEYGLILALVAVDRHRRPDAPRRKRQHDLGERRGGPLGRSAVPAGERPWGEGPAGFLRR